jgi:hypothetical protein
MAEEEDLPELDYVDPLKREADDEEEVPGLDPALTIPPED